MTWTRAHQRWNGRRFLLLVDEGGTCRAQIWPAEGGVVLQVDETRWLLSFDTVADWLQDRALPPLRDGDLEWLGGAV